MNNASLDINDLKVERAFSKQSTVFDEEYSQNKIIQYKRKRVREHLLHFIKPESSILELNSGTGEDAIFLAGNGHRIHATDISAGMQNVLKRKVHNHSMENKISTEICSFNNLQALKNKGPYDVVFSNFGGLNCTEHLDQVLLSFHSLIKPNGIVTLVIIPKFCLWEFLLLFKGKFKTAFRRFFSKKGREAQVEGVTFKCWYYNPSFVINTLKENFRLLKLEGLCTIVPPSYVEGFGTKHPITFEYLKRKEDFYKCRWPWKCIGDYYIITLQKIK